MVPARISGMQEVTKNELTEVDVTAVVPADLRVSDYVTVNFELDGKFAKTQVVGMRFVYAATDGPVGPTGPPGSNRPDGAQQE